MTASVLHAIIVLAQGVHVVTANELTKTLSRGSVSVELQVPAHMLQGPCAYAAMFQAPFEDYGVATFEVVRRQRMRVVVLLASASASNIAWRNSSALKQHLQHIRAA